MDKLEKVKAPNPTGQRKLFDYSTLAEVDRQYFQEGAVEVRLLMKRSAQDVIKAGWILMETKRRNPKAFKKWIDVEFGMSEALAHNWINVARRFTPEQLENVPVTTAYLLGAKSTPESARKEILEKSKTGKVSVKEVKQVVTKHKQAAAAKAPKQSALITDAKSDKPKSKTDAKADEAVKRFEERNKGKAVEKEPTIEDILKGKTLVVTYAYIPQLPDKVNIGVRVGDDVALTENILVELARVSHLPEVVDLIKKRVEKANGKEKKAEPKKSTTKK